MLKPLKPLWAVRIKPGPNNLPSNPFIFHDITTQAHLHLKGTQTSEQRRAHTPLFV